MVKPIYVPQAGRVIEFSDAATDAQIHNYVNTYFAPPPAAPAPAAPPPERSLSGAFSSGISGLLGSAEATTGAVAEGIEGLAGSDSEWSDYFYGLAKEDFDEASKYQGGDVWGAKTWGDMGYSALEGIAQSAPQTALTAGLAMVPGAGPALAFGASTYLTTGQHMQRQAQEQNISLRDTDAKWAALTAVPSAALDTLGAMSIARGIPQGVVASYVGKMVAKAAATGIGKTAAAGASEAVTETAQQAIEILQADPAKLYEFSPDVQKELLNAATLGGLTGSALHATFGPLESYVNKRRAEPGRQLEEDINKEADEGRLEAQRAQIEAGVESLAAFKPVGTLEISTRNVEPEPGNPDIPSVPVYTLRNGDKDIHDFSDTETAIAAANEYKARFNADIQIADNEVDNFFDGDTTETGEAPQIDTPDTPDIEGTKAPEVAASEPIDTIEAPLPEDQLQSDGETPTAPQARKAKLNPIPYTTKRIDEATQKAVTENGMGNVIDYSGRKMVVVDVNGVKVPYYLSSGLAGKTEVPAGKWYPFFGIGPNDGWINKASQKQMANYYGSKELRAMGEELDATIGDVRSDQTFPRVGATGEHIKYINDGFDAADNSTPDTPKKVAANIKKVVDAVKQGDDDLDIEASFDVGRDPNRVNVIAKQVGKAVEDRMKALGVPDFAVRLRNYIAKNTATDINPKYLPDAATTGTTPRGMANVDAKGEQILIDLAYGIYDPKLTVDEMTAKVIDTLNHEVIHGMVDAGLFTNGEWKMMARAARAQKFPGKKYTFYERAEETYGAIYGEAVRKGEMTMEKANARIEEEAVAEMFREWVKNPKSAPVPVRGLLNRALQFIKRLFSAFKAADASAVFKNIESGEIGARTRDFANPTETGVTQPSIVPVPKATEPPPEEESSVPKFAIAPPKNAAILSQTKAVDKNGNPVLFYHGTVVGPFKSFRTPSFFTESPDEAGAYTHWNVLASREKALGQPKYKVIQGQGGITETVVPYIGIISDIPYEDRGKIYATDDGVVRKNADGTVDLFSGWVVDYDGSSGLDPDTAKIERGDGSAVQNIVDDYRDFIDRNFPEGEGVGGRIAPVYLNIKNPIEVPVFEANRLGARLDAMTPEQIERYIDDLRAKGYDGIATYSDTATIYPDIAYELGGVPRQFIPFSEDQVISAFDERLTGVSPAPDAPAPKFSLSPTRPEASSTAYVEAGRDKIFAKAQVDAPIYRRLRSLFYGEGYRGGEWPTALRVHLVDKDAKVLKLEKEANQRKKGTAATGNYQRFEARYSAYVALQMAERASHVASAVIRKGALVVKMDNGDINSAYVDVPDGQTDSIKEVVKLLMDGPVNAQGQKTSLMNIFRDYAVSVRGHRLDNEGRQIPLDKRWMQEALARGKAEPNVIAAWQMYQRFNKKMMQAALDSGTISKDAFSKFTKAMDYYGFYREFGEELVAQKVGGKPAGEIKIIKYKGSTLGNLASDPLMVMVQNANFWTGAIMKNIAAQKSFNLLKSMGEARILPTGREPDIAAGEQPEVMFFRKDGVTHRFAVKDYLLTKALGASDQLDMPAWIQMLGFPSRILRETVTRDPRFVVANMLRDTLSTWVLRGESIKPILSTVKGYGDSLRNTTAMERLVSFGVAGSYDEASRSSQKIADNLRMETLPNNVLMAANPKTALDIMWRALGRLSDASDAATRLPVYEKVLQETGDEYEAAWRALEVMNFSRHGSWNILRYMTAVIPFLNARIQGFDVLYQGLKSAGKVATGRADSEMDSRIGRRVLVRGLMLAAVAVALEMLNEDDEDYKQLPSYIKDGSLLIPLSGVGLKGKYVAVPKPFEAGFIFATLPQHIYRASQGEQEGRATAKLFWEQFAGTFGVNPIPQAFVPLAENYFNIDYFTGQPLVSTGKQRLDPSLQYNGNTSKIARMLGDVKIFYNTTTGRFEGMSPIMIDNLITGYGGPMGTYFLAGTDAVMTGMNVGADQIPYRSIADIPAIRQFLVDAKSKTPQSVTDAYELFGIVDEVNRTFSRLRATGDVEALKEYAQDNLPALQAKRYVMKMVDTLNKVKAQERIIERSNTMTREQKIAELARLRDIELQVTSQVVRLNAMLR